MAALLSEEDQLALAIAASLANVSGAAPAYQDLDMEKSSVANGHSDGKNNAQELAFFTDANLAKVLQEQEDARLIKELERKPKEAQKKPAAKKKDPKENKKAGEDRGLRDILGNVFGFSPELPRANVCKGCNQPLYHNYIVVGSDYYHSGCFCCSSCTLPIDGQYSMHRESGQPYHIGCYRDMFNPRCRVCSTVIEGRYNIHSFFESEKYCTTHHDRRKCFSCSRKEPLPGSGRDPFIDIPDGRAICHDCVGTIVMDSSTTAEIYQEVIRFMETTLQLKIPDGMREVPVLAVDLSALNEKITESCSSSHGMYDQSITRGVTLSSVGQVRHFLPGTMALNLGSGMLSMSAIQAPLFHIREDRAVTAILVLYGLPRDLTAGIIAHEATHAWKTLREDMPFDLPPKVEEGLCQLISHMYLQHLQATQSEKAQQDIKDVEDELRKYFIYEIEANSCEVYGDGYRESRICADALGLDVLLDYIRGNKEFPAI